MRNGRIFSLVLLLGICMFYLPLNLNAQSKTSPSGKAAEGDSVWVVINHVKPEKRAQFERFVYEIFWPGAAKLDQKAQRAFALTRVLIPAKAEEDGTYTYVFLMDPIVPGQEYWIDNLLKKMYPADKAAAYLKMFTESLARDGESYRMLQSKVGGAPKR